MTKKMEDNFDYANSGFSKWLAMLPDDDYSEDFARATPIRWDEKPKKLIAFSDAIRLVIKSKKGEWVGAYEITKQLERCNNFKKPSGMLSSVVMTRIGTWKCKEPWKPNRFIEFTREAVGSKRLLVRWIGYGKKE